METKSYTVYKFEELSEEVQEKALERYRYLNVEDSSWHDYDGKTGFTAKELQRMKVNVKDAPSDLLTYKNIDLLTYKNMYFDLDRSWYIQFIDADFSDDEIARKFLRVPATLWNRVWWSIENHRENTTKLTYEWQGDKELTKKQEEILDRACEIFSDKMEEALKELRDTYEYLITDEAVKEYLIINEYDFTEDGKID